MNEITRQCDYRVRRSYEDGCKGELQRRRISQSIDGWSR